MAIQIKDKIITAECLKLVSDETKTKAPQTEVNKLKQDKLDKNQGTGNSGKFMKVGIDGKLIPDVVPIPDVSKQIGDHNTSPTSHNDIREDLTRVKENLKEFIPKDQGIANKDKILGIGADGMVVPTNKPTIPTKLPNPQKLTFQGAVTAEYDGSGAVTVTIPSGGVSGTVEVERIEKLATDTTVELVENKLYIFPEMASLTYTLKAPSKTNVANEYHFVFKSGASATQLVHAVGVNIGTFKVEPNKIYEISIMENLLTSQSWAVV